MSARVLHLFLWVLLVGPLSLSSWAGARPEILASSAIDETKRSRLQMDAVPSRTKEMPDRGVDRPTAASDDSPDLIPEGETENYAYDGLGSTRFLIQGSGTAWQLADSYAYDAYGIPLTPPGSIGTTRNHYRYTGEQWDADLKLYYLRARYYSPYDGRFITMDSFEGHQNDPLSLHKYLYAHANPVNGTDPSGHESLASLNFSMAIVSQMVMHELRGAHGALVGARAMFGSDEDLNSIIHGMEVVMAVDDAVSTVALGAGLLYGGYKLITFVSNGRKLIKNIRAITAAEANAGHTYPNPSGYGPAYKAGTRPRQFTTAAELKFVRVHGPSNQDGGWLVRADEIAGMNAKQIQEHLALKHTPTHISDVTVPAGVEMRVGIAAEQENSASLAEAFNTNCSTGRERCFQTRGNCNECRR